MSDNGLSPDRRQAIICTNAGILLIWTLENKLQWSFKSFNPNSYIFIQENVCQNVVWKMPAILSRPQCVNPSNYVKNKNLLSGSFLFICNDHDIMISIWIFKKDRFKMILSLDIPVLARRDVALNGPWRVVYEMNSLVHIHWFIFSIFFVKNDKHGFRPGFYIHIWQASPQLSCGAPA